ncbi:MAG: redoxin family protein [Flavobacterium sp.]|uniref:TlpA family protein disulfide reductase n=1 Tax=Flavobacterium sp. TaxID=239 RepID=UPI0032643D71
MKYLLSCLFLIQFVSAQNVSIKLKFENTSDSIPITANKSINDDAGYFLMNTDTIYTKNNQAELKFNAVNPGYMYFTFSKANPVINLLYEPNEVIQLKITKDQDNKYAIEYDGKNSDVLLAINFDTIYKYQKFAKKLRPIIFNAKKGSDILTFIKSQYAEGLKQLQGFYDNKTISKKMFDASRLYLEATLSNNSKSIIEDIFRIEEEYVNTKLPKSEFVDLLNNLMHQYSPFDNKFKGFTTYATLENLQAASKFINESGSDEQRYDNGLWKNKNAREYYNFIPLQYQEKLFAHLFVNDRLDENDFKQFKLVFPNSKYTTYLEKYLKNKKATIYKPYAFGYFLNNEFEYISQVNSIDIEAIIKDNFKGKAVFVDLWASYCGPCFQEFSYSQKLFSFLKTNAIEMLYINIDREKDIAKWQPNIKSSYLEGNHIFASDKIQKSLQKLLKEPNGVYIPRYLLFNSKGELVLPNTKKPSEEQPLYNEILKALK